MLDAKAKVPGTPQTKAAELLPALEAFVDAVAIDDTRGHPGTEVSTVPMEGFFEMHPPISMARTVTRRTDKGEGEPRLG